MLSLPRVVDHFENYNSFPLITQIEYTLIHAEIISGKNQTETPPIICFVIQLMNGLLHARFLCYSVLIFLAFEIAADNFPGRFNHFLYRL